MVVLREYHSLDQLTRFQAAVCTPDRSCERLLDWDVGIRQTRSTAHRPAATWCAPGSSQPGIGEYRTNDDRHALRTARPSSPTQDLWVPPSRRLSLPRSRRRRHAGVSLPSRWRERFNGATSFQKWIEGFWFVWAGAWCFVSMGPLLFRNG